MRINLSEPCIRRPVMTTLIMLAIIFFGVLSYFQLPVSALPNISYPTVQVSVNYPGGSAETVANLIAGPLERQFMTNVTNVNILTSSSYYENTNIIIQFDLSKNINIGMQEIQQAINEAQNQLPSDLPTLPTYKNFNPSETPIIYLVVTSETEDQATLYEYGYTFMGQRLSMLEGVAQIQVYGYPHAVRVFMDPQSLAAKNIGFNEVSDFLNNANPNMPTGKLYGPKMSYTLNTEGQMFDGDVYDPLIMIYRDGQPIKIEDVGYAENSLQNDKVYFRILTPTTNTPVIVLAIQRQLTANVVQVCDTIMEFVKEFEKELPGGINIIVPYNQAEFIREGVADVEFTLLLAFVLVVAIIFLYLGKIRNTVIPTVTLPLTIVGTFAIMHVFGYNLDILSLLALTLSIGFLIDDAIVVLENIVRHVQEGKKPFQAALDGSRQISFTVLSMSLSLCAVFIPMMFMSGVIGRLFHEFAVVIIVAILISGFISLTLTPMMCSRFIPPYTQGDNRSKMEVWSDKINNYFIKHYDKALWWVLKRKWFAIFCGIVSVVISVLLLIWLPKTFLPEDDLSIIEIFTQSEEGTSPYQMFDYQRQINEFMQQSPYMETTVCIAGYPTSNQGITFVNLLPPNKRPPINKIVAEYYEALNSIPGVSAFPKAFPLINLQVGTAQSGKGNYQYTLESFKPEHLYPAAIAMLDQMKNNPNFAQVSSDMQLNEPQLKIEILRDQAKAYQITAADIETALKLAYGETFVARLDAPQNQYYVVLQVEKPFYTDPSDLATLYVRSSITKELVPILSVVNAEVVAGPLTINHTNGLNSVTLSFDLAPGVPLGTALTALEEIAENYLPDDVTGSVQGTANIFRQSFQSLWFLLIISIVVIYIILGILYENFVHPITVLSALPLAASGALITLVIFQEPLSLYAFVGIIMLLGIVLKNGIMMIDFANEIQTNNPSENPTTAIHQACMLRFRPIWMTTLSTLFGALPIAVGFGGTMAKGRMPLGMAIVGGLIVSQLLTLFITPVVYVYLERFQELIQKRSKFFRADPDARQSDHS